MASLKRRTLLSSVFSWEKIVTHGGGLYQFSSAQLRCSVVSDSATPWIAACQASLFITNSWSLLKLNGHGFEWTPGVGDGQGGLACCGSWGQKESDMTEQLNRTIESL